MDKRKVIAAYLRGFITIQECAQILGMEKGQVLGMIRESRAVDLPGRVGRQPVNH
jgi:hypothetical protein